MSLQTSPISVSLPSLDLLSEPYPKMPRRNLIRQGSSWVLVLVLPPFWSVRWDSYVIWVLTLQMGGYIFLMDSAIQRAVGRFVAQAVAGTIANGEQCFGLIAGRLLCGCGATCLLDDGDRRQE